MSDSSDNAVNTLMLMANGILTGNDDLENQNDKNEVIKTKSVDFEGRGTVACHLCKKNFILKTLLKRHYITCHSYDPQCPSAIANSPDSKFCKECDAKFANSNEAIKHHLEVARHFIPGLFNPKLFNPRIFNHELLVEKSGVCPQTFQPQASTLYFSTPES